VKNWFGNGIKILLAAVFMISAGMLLADHITQQRAQKAYQEAQKLVMEMEAESETYTEEAENCEKAAYIKAEDIYVQETEEEEMEIMQLPEPEDPHVRELGRLNLERIKGINEDALGWIRIPGTVISYPIVQGEDNSYYLNHTWDKKKSKVGSIFLEALSSPDFTDYNTVIYGHKRGDEGTMFGPLHYYAEEEFYKEHPYLYIKDDTGVYRYTIFSAYEAPLDGLTYQIGFSGDESRQRFLDYCMEMSEVDTGIKASLDDKIITLSTCTGDGFEKRWVVQAKLPGGWANQTKQP